MPKTILKTFIICGVIVTLIFLPGSMAQIRKRSLCGRVVNIPEGVDSTEVVLYFGPGGFEEFLPSFVPEPNGTFCIENYARDHTSARLYVASFCRPDDVMLVAAPFWPVLRKERRFAGKNIVIDRGDLTRVGDVDVQLIYGHVTLRILDRRHQPLLTRPADWSPVWIRVKKQNGVAVHESGLSLADIARAVDLKASSINLALPKGTWTIEIALAGVPPNTGRIRRAVRWLRVPGELRIESCARPVDVAVSASKPAKP